MKRSGLGLLLFLCALTASARSVQLTLWVSGDTGGILPAGREAPGHPGVIAHIQRQAPDGYWIDVGGGMLPDAPASLRNPDVHIPGLELLQTRGQSVFENSPLPWTLLNIGVLPQYPEAEVPIPPLRQLRHPDGPEITVLGLLPADTPRRVPPPLLRPLRILPPEVSLQNILAELRASAALPVLALPEGADPSTWSRTFPDIPLFIEPASANPAVIPLDNGRRYRIRPGTHGRAVIRVSLTWDTVQREYTNLFAEVEWVRPPDQNPPDLPPDLTRRLRLLPEAPTPADLRAAFIQRLLERGQADMALIPKLSTRPPPYPQSPESWRVHLFPRDVTWMLVHTDAETLRNWIRHDLPGHEWIGPRTAATRILLPAPLAAAPPFRDGLNTSRPPATPTPFTARDLLFPQ